MSSLPTPLQPLQPPELPQLLQPPPTLPCDCGRVASDSASSSTTTTLSVLVSCAACGRWLHYDCLRTTRFPALYGDIFFVFRCSKCNGGMEFYSRSAMNWVETVYIAVINLVRRKPSQLFFHWRNDICRFLEEYWSFLHPNKPRTSAWENAVQGVLTVHSHLFKCLLEDQRATGWWTLTQTNFDAPSPFEAHRKSQRESKIKIIGKLVPLSQPIAATKTTTSPLSSLPLSSTKTNKPPLPSKISFPSTSLFRPQVPNPSPSPSPSPLSSSSSSSSTSSSSSLTLPIAPPPPTPLAPIPAVLPPSKSNVLVPQQRPSSFAMSTSKSTIALNSKPSAATSSFTTPKSSPRSTPHSSPAPPQPKPVSWFVVEKPLVKASSISFSAPVTPVPQKPTLPTSAPASVAMSTVPIMFMPMEMPVAGTTPKPVKTLPDSSSVTSPSPPSSNSSKGKQRIKADSTGIRAFTPIRKTRTTVKLLEEKQEWDLLHKIENLPSLDSTLSRLRRKLILRRYKSSQHFRLFNIDSLVTAILKNSHGLNPISKVSKPAAPTTPTTPTTPTEAEVDLLDMKGPQVDPYSCYYRHLYGKPMDCLAEGSFQSQYTYRRLRSFIWRDFESKTPHMKLLDEIGSLAGQTRPPSSIDYVYFRPEHLHQVNQLLCNNFWPGIDMTEALAYPDFSVVACYKRLVVGCAFMTPEAYITYILVHPGWQGAGIGTFMLYHLIQTCKGKDITLHVSANNPAMILYQRFGFKAEEFIVDFYDKYLPDGSKMCKNAFFVRLRR